MAIINRLAKAAAGAAYATLLAGGAAQADDSRFSFYWTVTGASDYLFRGISYTQGDPTVNSYEEIDYDTKSLFGTAYIAFWTSNIDIPEGAGPWEQDIYAGIRPVTGPINWDLAVWYYTYADCKARDCSSSDLDYVEFKIGASWSPVENWTLGGTVYLTPNQDAASPENIAVEGLLTYAIPGKLWIFDAAISGGAGFQDAEDNAFYGGANPGYWGGDQEYVYWNAGIKLTVEKFFMDFRYWDTDISPQNPLADETFLFSAGVNLLP